MPFNFKMGADPEFNITMQKKRIAANNLFKTIMGSNKDFKADNMGYKVKEYGSLGWDGNAATAEIRPTPATTPKEIVKNLKGIFESVKEHTQLFEFSTISEAAPVGGHIHLELPESFTPDSQMANKLFKQITSFYIPLLISENSLNMKVRNAHGYGEITDHREQRFGERYTIEMRAPSAEWLTTEKLAEATFAYLGTVYNEILNHPEKMKKHKKILITCQDHAKALKMLTTTNFVFITEILTKRIKKAIQTFETYPEYKKEIDFLLNPKKVLQEKEKAGYNILKGWNIYQKMNTTKKQFISQKSVTETAKKINLDDYEGSIHIPYNADPYVDTFVRALKHRILANKMKTTNNYYVFGLKKGFPKMLIANKNNELYKCIDLIESTEDAETIYGILDRLNTKFLVNNSGELKHNNNEKDSKYILIGLPYEERMKQDTKQFLGIVFDLEKGKIKAEKIPDNLPSNPNSKIYSIYVKEEDRVIQTVADYDSHTVNQARREIAQEELSN